MYLIRNCDEDPKGNPKQLDSSVVNSYNGPEQDPNSGPEQDPDSGPEQDPNHGPQQDPNEDDFIQESVNNNNLITIEHKHKLTEKYLLNSSDLNYSTSGGGAVRKKSKKIIFCYFFSYCPPYHRLLSRPLSGSREKLLPQYIIF